MSFFSDLFAKLKGKKVLELAPHTPETGNDASPESAPSGLDELRFRARTGDPKLTERHHSGNF